MGYAQSLFREFESYHRIVVGLDEDDIRLIFKQYNGEFMTFELSPGIYTSKEIAMAVYTKGDHEGNLQNEYDDITRKTKLNLTRFGSTFGTLGFVERSYFNTLLGFTPCWDYKPTNAIHVDSLGVDTFEKILNLSTIDKINLKCDVIDGAVQNALRHPILLSFVLDTKPGYK